MVDVIFLFPLVMSAASLIYFFQTEMDGKWKYLALGLVLAALAMQFVPALRVHFLIPLGIQVVVCLWFVIHWKLNS